MRTKQIIPGLNNSQKFRFIVRQPDAPNSVEFGMYLTVKEFSDRMATTLVREAIEQVLTQLAKDRAKSADRPTGLLTRVPVWKQGQPVVELDVQVDLV